MVRAIMTKNTLTNEDTWNKHWSDKKHVQLITDNYCYSDFIKYAVRSIPLNGTCIELGGFPGKFSIFFKKYCGLNPTLLDFHFDKKIMKELIEFNGLQEKDIKCIKADLLTYESSERYDMVCSFGLIEHFIDLKQIIGSHLEFLKPGGIILIVLPNFRGINGLVQKFFDPQNLAIHNLKTMDLFLLKTTLAELNMTEIEVSYDASTQVWLEDLENKGIILNILIRVINRLMNIGGKMFGMQNRLLSTSIMVLARSPKSHE
jgi:SAM-dependent methyltransferase